MKKFVALLTIVATLSGSVANAQQPATGKSAAAGKSSATDNFAWGIGLAGLAGLGVVVGIVAASASSSPSTFSH